MKKEFGFYIDHKHTIWYRNQFSIEADSLKEAKAKLIAICKKDTDDLPSDDWDLLHETATEMDIDDNDGEATKELYATGGDIIWTNKPNQND